MREDFPKAGRWLNLTNYATHFVSELLHKDASKRPDALEALNHPWLVEAAGRASSRSSEMGAETMLNLQRFAHGSHLRKAALTMLAFSLTSRELQDLEEVFLSMDKSCRGAISMEEFAEAIHGFIEVSPEEVAEIFQGLDFSNGEEIRYTPFIAAMLATRLRTHEDKVRAAFDSFDVHCSGFITADNLVSVFHGQTGEPLGPRSFQGRALTKSEAEDWIREVDYKGNGVIDYQGFVAALMGKELCSLPALDSDCSPPIVKVFDIDIGLLPCRMVGSPSISTALPVEVSDSPSIPETEEMKSHTFSSVSAFKVFAIERLPISSEMAPKEQGPATKAQLCTVFCDVDDSYFS
jgi:calcium-dependent protein kinase